MGYIFIHKHTERNKKKEIIFFFSIKVQRRTTPICEVLPISVIDMDSRTFTSPMSFESL